jgi:hypothetical protein
MIRNYEDGSGNIILIDSTSVTDPRKVFTSSSTGAPIAGPVIGQTNAVTTIAFCNTAAPNSSDESINAVNVNIYIVRSGKSFVAGNLIVSNLTIPAGETVFFSEERIVLDSGDEIWVGTSATSRLSVTVSALAV